MGARPKKEVLQVVSGWPAVELVLKCLLFGMWQLAQMSVVRLWRGQGRRSAKHSPVEVTVDAAVGRHCYIKIMGVKYHYVETGPKSGQPVVVLGDAPETAELWGGPWAQAVQALAERGHRVLTLDLRGTGASEGGSRADLAPPRAVDELAMLLTGLGVSEHNPAILIGFGIGGMLTWYLAHCRAGLVRRLAVVRAPHPNLYWQFPPADFCKGALHFMQWPWLPERWLAERGSGGASSRARDWLGALHYVRGAAWWSVAAGSVVRAPALLVGGAGAGAGAGAGDAAQLVASAQYCAAPTLRQVARAQPGDAQLAALLLRHVSGEGEGEGGGEVAPPARGLVTRVLGGLGAVAGRGRLLSRRLALPAR